METLLTLIIAAPVIFYFVSRHWKEHKRKNAQAQRIAGRGSAGVPESKVGQESRGHAG